MHFDDLNVIEAAFHPYLKKEDYTFIAPTLPEDKKSFWEIAIGLAFEGGIRKPTAYDILSDRDKTMFALKCFPAKTIITIYVFSKDMDKNDIPPIGLKDYCPKNDIAFTE